MLAESNLSPAEWTCAVHRVLLAQAPQARLAEDVPARLHLERLVEQVEADGADNVLRQGVQLRLRLEKFPQSGLPLLLHTLMLPPSQSV